MNDASDATLIATRACLFLDEWHRKPVVPAERCCSQVSLLVFDGKSAFGHENSARIYDWINRGLSQPREELKWALRTAKLLECVASDPDSSGASAVALLRAKVWQLERSWKMLYDPVREEEADRILALH